MSIQDSINNIENVALRDRADDFLLNTDMGDHFERFSIAFKDDNSGFGAIVDETLTIGDDTANVGDTVEFDQWCNPIRVIKR